MAKLETVNKELEAFSYSVSHDLRAPLRAIHGYTKILSEEYLHKADEDAKQMMSSVMNNAKKMGQLIDDLLSFSRLGKKDLQLTTFNLKTVVEAAIEDLKISMPGSKAQISICPLNEVTADYNLIVQVFTNLISNSIKYSAIKENPFIEIGSMMQEGATVYYVKDNGVGFDMKYYNKLFGVFQRLHSMNEFEGTGVGLALIKRIIVRHKGKIWAESEVGKGATFYFTLNNNQL